VGGHWGLDRWLLPVLGTPWTRAEAQVDRFAHRASTFAGHYVAFLAALAIIIV
jgi:hypothetical protein